MLRGRSKHEWPHMIVRRSKPVVGVQRPRTIVRRRGVVSASDAPRGGEAVIGAMPRGLGISRQWLILAALAVLIVVVVGGGIWAYRGPYFQISEVSVIGAGGRVGAVDVLQQAGLNGQSMFTADLAEAQRRVASLPLVASVKIERQWPHGIAITVTERQPWGTWVQDQSDYVIDRTGVVLGPGRTKDGTPVIKSSDAGSRQVGDRVDYQAVDSAAAIYQQLPAVLHTTISDISFVPGTGVEVTIADGTIGIFGDSSSIDYKLAVWAAVARQAQQEGVKYTTVDLRFGNRPVVR